MYQATVLNVMIASPGDVSQERQLARTVIHDWNAAHAAYRKIVLMSLGWEVNAVPELGGRLQGIINKQLLEDTDILIGIFWTRLGSPTGVAPSGTVEEIREHVKRGKHAMVYFSSVPVVASSIDPEQYAGLQEFKASLRQEGLYEEYQDLTEFQTKLARQLAHSMNKKFDFRDTEPHSALPVPFSINFSEPAAPRFSPDALDLLREATRDKQGVIMKLLSMDGLAVTTNGRSFSQRGDPRSEARWGSAVEELDRAGLIEDRRGKGEVYFVTDAGYRVAEALGRT
jgi:hypothetical protein